MWNVLYFACAAVLYYVADCHPSCIFNRKWNILTLPSTCCLIERYPAISRLEYKLVNGDQGSSYREYDEYMYPIIGSQKVVNETNVTIHYFGSGSEQFTFSKYLEIIPQNYNRYLLCSVKSPTSKKYFEWDSVQFLSTCGFGHKIEKHLALSKNLQFLKLCHCPRKLELKYEKLQELQIIIDDKDFISQCLAIVPPNLCDPNPCGPSSQCREGNGAVSCSCLPSYIGNPPNCRPECVTNNQCSETEDCFNHVCSNPCNRSPCGKNAKCTVKSHEPVCYCPKHFNGNPHYECVPAYRGDISTPVSIEVCLPTDDACNTLFCGPNSECDVGSDGEPVCSCLDTFAGSPPNCTNCIAHSDCDKDKTCNASRCIDPCQGACGTNTECEVINHNIICVCMAGYIGDPFKQCFIKIQVSKPLAPPPPVIYSNPCEGDICGPNSKCKLVNEQPLCSCQPLFIGSPPNCRAECLNSSDCSANMSCISQKCEDPCVNACGVDAECKTINHSPLCFCPNGYTGDPFTICSPEENSPPQGLIMDPCSSSPCGANSECENNGSIALCSCLNGFIGTPPDCISECVVDADCSNATLCRNNKCVDPCPESCGTDSECLVKDQKVLCFCSEHYSGDPFEACMNMFPSRIGIGDEDICDPSPCGPNSLCQKINGLAACSCAPSFEGKPPSCRKICRYDSDCSPKQICDSSNHKCVNICSKHTCGTNVMCNTVNHVPSCSCPHGYTGDAFNQCHLIPHMTIHAPVIKKISLEHYSFSNIKFSAETLKSVEEIEMHRNRIDLQELVYTLKDATSLRVLNLSDSERIKDFPEWNVKSLSSVVSLDLCNSKIENLEYGDSFTAFLSLRNINLTQNPIRKMNPNIFSRMNFLNFVNMSDSLKMNDLTLQLKTANKISHIDLSKNRLLSLNLTMTKPIDMLDISENHLSHRTFSYSCTSEPCIKKLNLENNNIELTEELFWNLRNVSFVNLMGYKLHCTDCDLLKSKVINDFLNNVSLVNMTFDYKDNRLRCTEPIKITGELVTTDLIKELCPAPGYKNMLVIIAVPVCLILLLLIIMAGIGYKYRFEISYWIQYVKLKKRKSATCYCDPEGYEYDVFVSYCSADRRWVWTVLRPGLENSLEKYRLCLHERDFLLGSAITENVEKSMRTSRYCIMVLTNDFIASQWCRWEMELASSKLIEERREFLILVELEPIDTSDVPPHLKLLISTRTYLEWNLQKFSEKSLLDRLKRALGPSIFEKNMESKFNTMDTVESSL